MTKATDNRPSVEFLRECLEYRDGVLYWKARPASHFRRPADHQTFIKKMAGKVAGRKERANGYVTVGLRVNGRAISMAAHRIVWALHHGAWPAKDLDHRNRVRNDNRIENLQEVTPAENVKNSARNRVFPYVAPNNSRPGTFQAQVRVGDTGIHIGVFETELEAHEYRTFVNAELEKLARHLAKKSPIGRKRKNPPNPSLSGSALGGGGVTSIRA